MKPELYLAAINGKPETVSGMTADYLAGEITPRGDTVLHIAARFGHSDFARAVLGICPSLLAKQNADEDTPFHVAASGGYLDLVKALTATPYGALSHPDEESHSSSNEVRPWRLKSSTGNTPLHEAVKNRNSDLALHLVDVDSELVNMLNDANESPLFIAARMGLETVLKRILEIPGASWQGPMGMKALHGAAMAEVPNADRIVKLLLEHKSEDSERHKSKVSELVRLTDDRRRTALHYAAANSLKVCHLLLKQDPGVAYIDDDCGYTPFMIAIRNQIPRTALAILDYCPDCGEIHDGRGRNAFHFLIKMDKINLLRTFFNRPELEKLINKADNDGNTPIHLAIKHRFTHAALELARLKNVNIDARNNAGKTAMDLVEDYKEVSIQQYKIWRQLRRRHAIRGQPNIESINITISTMHPNANLQSMVNTMSVVAALLATITFAAVFTMPGGLSTDGENKGSALFSRRAAFKAFIVSDTFSFSCSIAAIFNLNRALMGDAYFMISSIIQSWALLLMSLFGTAIAFVTAVYAILSRDDLMLAIIVCTIGCCGPFFFRLSAYIAQSTIPMFGAQYFRRGSINSHFDLK